METDRRGANRQMHAAKRWSADRQTDRQTNRCTADSQTDRQTDRQIDVLQTVKQTNRPQPSVEYPCCLQTTRASSLPHKSSHTVPHLPLKQISTLPSDRALPPASRISPLEQAAVPWAAEENKHLLLKDMDVVKNQVTKNSTKLHVTKNKTSGETERECMLHMILKVIHTGGGSGSGDLTQSYVCTGRRHPLSVRSCLYQFPCLGRR